MVKAFHLRLSTDLALLNDWMKDNNQQRTDAYYKEYRAIMAELMKEQHALLLVLNKKENINDDIVRQQLELLDLEEEKMRRHFQWRKSNIVIAFLNWSIEKQINYCQRSVSSIRINL
jgi:CPA1 family monovalent cation:H+ antiporter